MNCTDMHKSVENVTSVYMFLTLQLRAVTLVRFYFYTEYSSIFYRNISRLLGKLIWIQIFILIFWIEIGIGSC